MVYQEKKKERKKEKKTSVKKRVQKRKTAEAKSPMRMTKKRTIDF